MPWLSRREGTYVADAPALRRLMPHLMPTRMGSVVFFDQHVDLTKTLPFLRESGHTLFELILASVVRTLAARPQLNRFIVGRRLYQRNAITLSFAVKKELSDRGAMTTVKARFEPGDTLADVSRRVKEAIAVGRGKDKTTSEKEMSIVTRMPRFLLRFVLAAQRALDYFNLLPASMIEADPLYASVFLANLGSVGLDAAYHHLYEYGTVPVFAVVGKVHKAPVVDPDATLRVADIVELRFAYDERIADGYYAARSLELFKSYVEHPETLGEPLAE